MDKSSSAALLIEYDNEKLISGTKVEISERREGRTGLKVVFVVVLTLSLLLSCLELAYVCKILTSRKQNNEPNSWKDSIPNSTRDRTRTSNTDSLTLLVSLMANEHFCQQHANKRTQVTPTIQRYLSGHYKRDPRHSSALIANDNSKDVTYGNFRVNPEFITIPKKGFYEVTTIVTIKLTHNSTEATHALYRQSGDAWVPMMQRTISVHPDVMAFQQSVLKESFFFETGDKLSLFVSKMYGVSEKTTPISVRYIGR